MAPVSAAAPDAAAWFEVDEREGSRVMALHGTLDGRSAARLWAPLLRAARAARGQPLVLDLAGVRAIDTAGGVLVLEAERAHGAARTQAASEQVGTLLRSLRAVPQPAPAAAPPAGTWWQAAAQLARRAVGGIGFVGELAVATRLVPRRRRQVRLGDLLRIADQAGVQAMPLSIVLGVLIGLILAFQSLVPMKQFGADVFVASLVSVGLVRELGPLLAAVLLSGRTGSAFAAEIGTMKVNQELDALAVMRIDPVLMLVLPRLLACLVVTPVMALVLELAGLLGMVLVLVGSGVPWAAIADQVALWVSPAALFGGLFKAAAFGAAVAMIGCRAGLATGIGPRAVGQAATRAVVGGITACIVLDGLFSVLFYRLGL